MGETVEFRRLSLAVMVCACLTAVGCGSDGDTGRSGFSVEPSEEEVEFRIAAQGAGSFNGENPYAGRTAVVVRSPEQEKRVVARLEASSISLGERFPRVDYEAQMLVILLAGPAATGGVSLQPEGVRKVADELIIEVTQLSPGDGCGATQALTYPYAMLVIAQDARDPRVETVRKKRANC